MKIKIFKNVPNIEFRSEKWGKSSNILMVTGLSGGGKSYLANELSLKYGALVFRPENLKHTKHINPEFENLLKDFFLEYPEIEKLARNKFNNCKDEDKNEVFRKYINLYFEYFLNHTEEDKLYVVEGIQLFSLIDFEKIRDYPFIIKGTSCINCIKNKYKRGIKNKGLLKFKDKFKYKVQCIKESGLYQFKHRKLLNKFIEDLSNYHKL